MSSMAELTEKVLKYLSQQDEPVTAKEVQSGTKLPLPVVIKVLQSQANEYVPNVQRLTEGERVLYQYIGPPIDVNEGKEAGSPAGDKASGGKPSKTLSTKRRASDQRSASVKEPSTRPGKTANVNENKATRPKLVEAQAPKPAAQPTTVNKQADLKLQVAEFLSKRPMNIARLAKELGVSEEMLEGPLQELVSDTLVEPREVMDDTVYKAKPSIMSKLPAASSDTKIEESLEVSSAINDAGSFELIDELNHSLAQYKEMRADLANAVSKLDSEIDVVTKKLKQLQG